ncbi:TPA: hypothetical protein ACF66O_004493, partial [Salmonella enterica]
FSNDVKNTDIDIIFTSICITLLITILFHITDATTYFFQRKNRERQSRFKQLLCVENNIELFSLKDTNWVSSFFNSSMVMYITIYLMAFVAYVALTYLTTSMEVMLLSMFIFVSSIVVLLVSSKKKREYS